MTALTIVAPGPLATVQDLGRPGYAHVGVPHSGGADRASMTRANRLVGNDEHAATIETTLGGLRLRADSTVLAAVTGAVTRVTVDGVAAGIDAALTLHAGSELTIETPTWGCRNYLAVRGGIDVPPVLGSRSTDLLSGLGPAPLTAGTSLAVGDDAREWPAATDAPVDYEHAEIVTLDVSPGPRASSVVAPEHLSVGEWSVSGDSNRVGVRLLRPDGSDDPVLRHRDEGGELRSEGMPLGAVQIPPSGRPVLFLADHPVTGGYPVVAVLRPASIDAAAQLVAGTRVRFRMR
ncbi:biotin-dependent carboxyltransferase family protein [Gordonia sinesedis]